MALYESMGLNGSNMGLNGSNMGLNGSNRAPWPYVQGPAMALCTGSCHGHGSRYRVPHAGVQGATGPCTGCHRAMYWVPPGHIRCQGPYTVPGTLNTVPGRRSSRVP